MPSYNDITLKAQRAAMLYLQGAALTLLDAAQVYQGLDTQDLQLPRVVCSCKQAEAFLNFDGLWDAELNVTVRTNAKDTTEEEHHLLAGEICSRFMTASIADDMSSAIQAEGEDYTAQFVVPKSTQWDLSQDEGKQSWVSRMTFSVKCCGSTILAA